MSDELMAALGREASLLRAVTHADGCFQAAYAEGWLEALSNNDIERIRDIWNRRLSYAPDLFGESIGESLTEEMFSEMARMRSALYCALEFINNEFDVGDGVLVGAQEVRDRILEALLGGSMTESASVDASATESEEDLRRAALELKHGLREEDLP